MNHKRRDNPSLRELRALSSSELKVYVSLTILSGPERHPVRQSLPELADVSGLSTGTVSKAVGELCRKGHISYEAGDNQHSSSVFRITRPLAGLRFGMADRGDAPGEIPPTQAENGTCSPENGRSAPISNRDSLNLDIGSGRGRAYKTREQSLAEEIARAFNDVEGIGLYLDYCRRYPETIIRRAYGEVKELPDSAIRRSRGALFNYLVQKYANEQEEQSNTGL